MKLSVKKNMIVTVVVGLGVGMIFISGCSKGDLKVNANVETKTNTQKSDSKLDQITTTAQPDSINNDVLIQQISEEKDYKDIKEEERLVPYAGLKGDDYLRVISLEELAHRIANTYEFLKKYPKSAHASEIMQWKNEYLHDYLYGNFKYDTSFNWMDEKAASNLNERVFYDEFLKSYEASISKYKGTDFAVLLETYLKLIKSQGNKTTEDVRKFVDDNAKYDESNPAIFKLPNQ